MSSSQAERRLILLSAGTTAYRQCIREEAGRLLGGVDWPRLAETLRLRRLLPTLGPRILELAEGRASDDFAAAVEGAITLGRRHGAFLQIISLRVMAALADARIRSAVLKGPLLGEAIYGDPGRRLSSDIDLLVSPDELPRAVEVVRQLGYSAPTDYVQEGGLPLLHFLLVHEQGELPPVELHWRVHWYERTFARERLLPPTCDQQGDWRPAPADELVALLLFYARDGFIDLRLASDLSAWWDTYGADLLPGALDELLGVYPALARAIPAAAKAAENTVGLPATQIIGHMPKLDLWGRMAVRLANPNPRSSQSQLYADMGLIDGLLMPRGGFGAFVRRQVILPPEVLDELDRRAPKQRARSSLSRGVGMLGRYGLTAARAVRAPETLS
jgi:putative nucleotidyltransferase-like protein